MPSRFVGVDLVTLYTKDHLTCEEIGRRVGVTRQSVSARLKRLGISSDQGEWVNTACAYCSCPMRILRRRWRRNVRVYCHPEHYYASRESPGAVVSRNGTRIARAIVTQHFDLQPEHVVHHEDRDETNNDLRNLWVFASDSDHMRHHHGRQVTPIWRGSDLRP